MLSYNRELNVAAAQIFHPRNGIGNTLAKLNAGRPVTIAYFGGSITAAAGWRPKTLAWFRQRYPRSEITEVNAAIGGTGSFLGVFRCRQDVLKHDPDLIFIEFAVNDGDEAPEAIWRQMEGIIRQARAANPMVDICYVYTLHTKFVPEISGGMNPSAASADEMLAEHYGIPSINVALRIVQLHSENKLIYSRTTASDGTFLPTPPGVVLFSNDECHPTDEAHEIYANLIVDSISSIEHLPAPGAYAQTSPFVDDNWENAMQAPIERSMLSAGWEMMGADDPIGRGFASRLPAVWQALTPGESIEFTFKGTAASLYDIMGPDGAQAIVTLDDQPPFNTARFDIYCTYHRLSTVAIGSGLQDEIHRVKIEISAIQPDRTPASSQETVDYDPKKYDGTVLRVGSILVVGKPI